MWLIYITCGSGKVLFIYVYIYLFDDEDRKFDGRLDLEGVDEIQRLQS